MKGWPPTLNASEVDLEEARIISWFAIGLRHEAIRLTKKYRRLREHELLILNDRLSQDAEDGITEILDTIAAPDDTLSEVEDSVLLQEALALLTPQQQKVIIATVLEGRTEREVAKQLGIAQQVVNRLKARALRRLKKHFVLDKLTAR